MRFPSNRSDVISSVCRCVFVYAVATGGFAVSMGGWWAPQCGCEGWVVFERGYCSTGLALFGFAGQMFAR